MQLLNKKTQVCVDGSVNCLSCGEMKCIMKYWVVLKTCASGNGWQEEAQSAVNGLKHAGDDDDDDDDDVPH